MLIGYARVSTDDQMLDLQRDALQAAGCERIYEDKAGGAKADRPGLKEALNQLRHGDTLVVWRLDRLGRSLKDLIQRAEALHEQGVGLRKSAGEHRHGQCQRAVDFPYFRRACAVRTDIDPGTDPGRPDRRTGARPQGVAGANCWTSNSAGHAVELYKAHKHTAKEVCTLMGISRATLYSYIEEFSDGL